MNDSVKSVFDYWNIEACGSHYITDYKNEKDFFNKYREFRYSSEWHIPLLVPFSEAKGKKVLEIGCGNGADGTMFALNGAEYTGIDLTKTAIDATKKHFVVLGLQGIIKIGSAEELEFENNSFDIVYSHGVLHHSPNPSKAFDEVYRVLKPSGQAIIMLYHKNSFNYYVRIMGYMRFRVLLKILSKMFCWKFDRNVTCHTSSQFISNSNPQIWDIHYLNFLRYGWSYLKSKNFVHHCTDGPACPYAYVFSRSDIKKLFSQYNSVQIKVAHFPIRKTCLGKLIPFKVEEFLAPKLGFYLFVFATK